MRIRIRTFVLLLMLVPVPVVADGGAVRGTVKQDVEPTFNIVESRVQVDGGELVFSQRLASAAGAKKPAPAGELRGAPVYSYVWPTSLDSQAVGFEKGRGILALAVTVHPDFDDTPLYDENGDSDRKNDGGGWHSHWVVLAEDERCGEAGLKVRDILDGADKLPATWPGLAILIDSPGYAPRFEGPTVTVRLPLRDVGAPETFRFDGVTSSLQVNADLHDPLLCIDRVFDVASGDLSLPGELSR